MYSKCYIIKINSFNNIIIITVTKYLKVKLQNLKRRSKSDFRITKGQMFKKKKKKSQRKVQTYTHMNTFKHNILPPLRRQNVNIQ